MLGASSGLIFALYLYNGGCLVMFKIKVHLPTLYSLLITGTYLLANTISLENATKHSYQRVATEGRVAIETELIKASQENVDGVLFINENQADKIIEKGIEQFGPVQSLYTQLKLRFVDTWKKFTSLFRLKKPDKIEEQIKNDAAIAHILQQQEKARTPQKRKCTQHTPRIKKQRPRYATTKRTFGTELPLPHILNNAHHLKVEQQTGVSCGYHATFNACAIEELFREGKQLTSQAIQNSAKQYHHLIRNNHAIEISEIINTLVPQVKLTNCYFLKIENRKVQPAGITFDIHQTLEVQIKQLSITDKKIIHCICNTGWHWVTVSIIKDAGKEPYIVYANSTNTPVTVGSPAYTFITHITQLIKNN